MSHTDIVPRAKPANQPDEAQLAEVAERTKSELDKIIEKKLANVRTAQGAATLAQTAAPQMIKYTPQSSGPQAEFATENRLVRVVERARDPFEPPTNRTKRVARGPPSPPAAVMHSPPRKLTAEDQAEWKIPPCISNWKNPKGWTMPLDKRLLADGRNLREVEISDNFAKLSESLFLAERKAREEVEQNSKMREMIERRAKEKKEQEYRELAALARQERATLEVVRDAESEDAVKRDAVRDERKREREREFRLERAKKSRLGRDEDRDITEKVALGMGAPKATGDALFDTRLFNQTAGIGHGFGAEDDYNVYERPLFAAAQASHTIYRPKAQEDAELYGTDADFEKLKDTTKFVPDKGFAGADATAAGPRAGPVPFERADKEAAEADPFGLDDMINEARSKSVPPKVGLEVKEPKPKK